MSAIVGVRFQKAGKVYHFDGTRCPDLAIGDHVIVDTTRGREMGWVVTLNDKEPPPRARPSGSEEMEVAEAEDRNDGGILDDQDLTGGERKPITRKASPQDMVQRQHFNHREKEALATARMRLTEAGVRVKLARAEYSFDGSRLTLYYGSEREIDLNRFKRDLTRALETDARIEFRQIGPRDVAKLMGGSGACGLATRCCSAFLTEFQPISIRMAKAQDLPLVPSEIAGMCGRLRCCLAYEYEFYRDARKGMPKVGKWVVSQEVSGKVVDRNILKQTVTIATETGRVEMSVKDVWVGETGQPPAGGSCGDGGCSGGACGSHRK